MRTFGRPRNFVPATPGGPRAGDFGVQCRVATRRESPPMSQNPQAGYFPRWTLRADGVVAPDERLPAGATLALGVQHVVAMFGATVLAPLLMGFDPNVAIFFSGIGPLI